MNYYGDKISENMRVTPEGYLVCENVPIGRTGYMEYLGRELPAAFNEPSGDIFKVYRRPEELFSVATIASFEGKPVTNTHPTANLDVNTVSMIERGHTQNIRRDGDFLIADLHVNDAGLISEIQNKLKREVSSGYDCSWHKVSEGVYEQREIIGNHVAVVSAGRAGPKIAIMDSALTDDLAPNNPLPNTDSKPNTGGKKKMGKMSKQFLTALGFKHYAADAEPEDIAKAMDAMSEEDEKKEPAKDAEPEKKEPAKDADPAPDNQAQENAEFKKLADKIKALEDEVAELKKGKAGDSKEDAEAVMDAIEEDLDKEAKDADPEEDDKKEPAKDADPDPEKKPAADAGLRKFVADMKPIIMAIPDEKVRLETAKKFASTVHDARSSRADNGYGDILLATAANKKAAMDAFNVQRKPVAEQSEEACKNWSAAGEKMRGGK
ncbi:DUF2213 domain-containing protein [Desulfosporosinus fructosivorans]|uniref:DUF2213 domain-containing protein n=1 Tax=Desulfosporosinus fructosivorans TaxID=2018669 RepID=A0A4Z0R0L5_9FIRM|nr:DUF2213 domain-containing protein [Desulfosporosinus fructosivorans]TGE35885.1 DUF2213 domain-containing protein [Desulfosporosinus fructosivorans]